MSLIGYIYALISLILNKFRISLCFVFEFIWSSLCLLASLRLYGLYEVSDEIYVIIFWGMTFFATGAFFGKKTRLHITFKGFSGTYEKDYIWKKHRIDIIFLLSFFCLLYMDTVVIGLLIKKIHFANIRTQYHAVVQSSHFIAAYYKYIAYPMAICTIIIFVADFIVEKKINKKFFYMAFLLTIMDFFCMGDRILIFCWIIGMMMVLLFIYDQLDNKGKKRVKMIFVISIVCFIWVISVIRSKELLKSIVNYLVGSMIFFSEKIKIYKDAEPTIFASSLRGLIAPFINVLELFGYESSKLNMANEFILNNQISAIMINSSKTYFNYFTTAFAFFYRDLKYYGVVLYSFLWGWISSKVFSQFMLKRTIWNVGTLYLILVGICISMMSFWGAESGLVWSYIYFLFTFKRKSVIKN